MGEELGPRRRDAARGRPSRPPPRDSTARSSSSPRCCSRRVHLPQRWLRLALTGYVGLTLAYGAVNIAQDFWHEQLVKRGWVDWAIPHALLPGFRPIWLVDPRARRSLGGRVRAETRSTRRAYSRRDRAQDGLPRLRQVRPRGQDLRARADHRRGAGHGRRTLVWVEGIAEPSSRRAPGDDPRRHGRGVRCCRGVVRRRRGRAARDTRSSSKS